MATAISQQVMESKARRRENGEEPIRASETWILSRHVKTPEDKARINALATAAARAALLPFTKDYEG